mgnify:CR=1 FL=1
MLTTLQMIIIVTVVLLSGGGAGIIFYLLERHKKPKFDMIDFSENFVAPKMKNSDISIDEVVKNFKLLD